MTSSAEQAMPLDMLDDFLAFTLAGKKPESARQGACGNGVRWSWLDDGILLLAPSAGQDASATALRSVLVSAGVHGDETAPIELLNRLVRDIADGTARLNCRLLIVLGNIDAMRDACRHLDDDLNRLFCGRHTQVPQSREAPRALALEHAARTFFNAAPNTPGARWHIDMHTAIRASAFEQFALLPVTGAPVSRAMFEWLGEARIAAVLLHTTRGNTYSQFTAQACGALACTLELGKVRPFGQNDLTRFAGADEAVRHLLAGTNGAVNSAANSTANAALPRAFTVVDQITKQSDAFELLVAPDVANFTPFARGTLLARDGAYCYTVRHDEERIVFPNARVKPGLRAGLLVIDTTAQTLAELV